MYEYFSETEHRNLTLFGTLCNKQNGYKNACSRKINVVAFLISAFFSSIMEILLPFLLGIFFVRGHTYLLLFRLNLYANCFGEMPADLVAILYTLELGPLWSLFLSLVWMQFLFFLLCTARGILPYTFKFIKKK